MAFLMGHYSEKVLAEACSPMGIPSKEEFFPSIAKLKKHLDDIAFEQEEHARRVDAATNLSARAKKQIEERIEHEKRHAYKSLDDDSDCYKGPIEDIKPGDILHWSRIEEYKSFIRTKGVNPKLWGVDETWQDTGQRPFATPAPTSNPAPTPKKEDDKNPFV